MHHQLDQEEQARELWNEERIRLESTENPVFQDDIQLCLALACANLGRKDEAVQLAQDVLSAKPISLDALLGGFRLNMAALVFVRAGEYEQAIDILELLLSVPSETSRALFRLDPAWDPLRANPRFRKMVEGEP